MKNFLSITLVLAMIFTTSASAFADQTPAPTTRDGIIGDIFHEEKSQNPTNTRNQSDNINTILSGTINNDGSVTTYQYEDNTLIEYHTTVPGSGLVVSTYINDDGTQSTQQTITKPDADTSYIPSGNIPINTISSIALPSTEILSPTSIRPLGYMHYRNTVLNQTFSIYCQVREKYHDYEYYTFNEGLANTLAYWTSLVISIFAFHLPVSEAMAYKVFQGAVAYGIFERVANKYKVIFTTKIACYWYDQEIHGTPTSPSGRGSQRYLPGVYAYVDYNRGKGLEVKTEGFTVRDWGNPSMGRWMLYNVFGIDEVPTSWTNLDN